MINRLHSVHIRFRACTVFCWKTVAACFVQASYHVACVPKSYVSVNLTATTASPIVVLYYTER